MRIVYLCTVNPPPPASDYYKTLEFFEELPEYLRPRTNKNDSPNTLIFADDVGSNWLPEFYDFAIAFISERFLTDQKALLCLSRAHSAFPNLICIDLYNSLSPELKEKAGKYTKRVLSPDEGREFLLSTLPEIASAYDLENEKIVRTIESDGLTFLSERIEYLNKQKKRNRVISICCYSASLIDLIAILLFTIWRFCIFSKVEITFSMQKLIVICIEVVVLSVLSVSIARFLFLLGKSFMVESIRSDDRAHAIGLGQLYLKLYKSKFKWDELRDVLQSWNIDNGSAFRNIDAKDIEAVSLDKVVDVLK